jgi:ATPase subunit of ABC transporter with duplicated ATPase domains
MCTKCQNSELCLKFCTFAPNLQNNMLTVSNLSLQFGKRVLFDEVNVKFTKGNCYGIIGANGAGKSTFLKILSGEQDPTSGNVSLEPGKRMSVLEQDHFAYDNFTVLDTILRGNKKLYKIKEEMDALYAKPDFSDEDGLKAGELGVVYEEMNGWNAESDAQAMLSNVGISEDMHYQMMSELENKDKVRVLLAQALFGSPDVLILDEPTNDLDIQTISWLEDFLAEYENTVIVVSHDRHFLDTVCTNIGDLDYSKLNLYTGNYSFWYQASQLATRQRQQANKKAEDKKKELQDFIARFSSNVAKAKQATARKKMIEKLNIDDIKPSSRRYPAIIFDTERQAGDQILEIKNLEKTKDGDLLFSDIHLNLKNGDKVAVISKNSLAITQFFEVLTENAKADKGEFNWGITTTQSYMPLDNTEFFTEKISLVDWLRQYTKNDEERHEEYMRGFLGKMLFSGDEALKSCTVLSGGEKMRCMFSRMMLQKANFLLMNEPTNHLDLESITTLNNSLVNFKGGILLASHDHEMLETVCNRIIELTPKGIIDREMTYDEYLTDKKVKELQEEMYA